ncbi:uncharacterized protein LOC112493233 [Ziziphus jujuba]|uniref:Uncharacterized protein LOC112493233 n=1 Tax=Ziziphus jujuba TaxID=326968 RepID=A0ABM3ZYM7_ZIZJJ|nr:uncharacterized protein LOC112493233 [Ziziphus jujuba]
MVRNGREQTWMWKDEEDREEEEEEEARISGMKFKAEMYPRFQGRTLRRLRHFWQVLLSYLALYVCVSLSISVLLYDGQFEELSARVLMLRSALNSDYHLTLPIFVHPMP